MTKVSSWLMMNHSGSARRPGGPAGQSAQDKYSLQVRMGSRSRVQGIRRLETVAVSQTGDLIEVILGNPR